MSVLAMGMVKQALTICPAEQGRIIRDPNLLFTMISNLGLGKEQFYNMFIQSLEQYIIATVLPSLREKHDEYMLREFLQRWTKHKDIDLWLRRLIDFLDQRHHEDWQPPIPLEKVGFTFFLELMYPRCKGQLKDAALAMIRKERANEQIDWDLLKDVLDILVELGSDQMDCYENDFENFFLEETTDHYSVEAERWTRADSYPAYIVKVQECFKKERERAGYYLNTNSMPKLVKRLQIVLLGQSQKQLLKKEESKFSSFLREGKVRDLSDMYRAFSESNLGAEIIAMFRMTLSNDIAHLMKQAEDSAQNMEVFAWKVIELHAKYVALVKECFQNHTRIGKVLVDALEDVCSKNVFVSSSVELLTTFCGNIVKHNSEMISDDGLVKVENLARMYSFFSEINGGLELLAKMFETVLMNEGSSLVNLAECSNNNKEPKKVVVEVQVLVWKIIELHEKYVALVKECFQNHPRFLKTLVDAFEVFCSKNVFASSSAELLATFCDNILKKGTEKLSDDNHVKVENLSRMYSLFSEIKGGLEPLAKMFETLLMNEGLSLVNLAECSSNNKEVFVWKIIELHEKYVVLVKECFQNHARFLKILIDAFEVFCSKNVFASSSAELLATFCDNILKKGTEKLSDEAVEDGIEKVVRMLTYISDKDIFAAFYIEKLERRLLFNKSANDEHEMSILKKFEQQFGVHFTWKMKGIVKDFTVSRHQQTEFEQFIAANPELNPGTDLSVTVWTAGRRSYKTFDMILPPEMVKCTQGFEEFYETRTNDRKLTWIYSLGTCNINATFKSKSVEIIVTPCQAAILLLFNEYERLSYSEIVTRLNLPDDIAVRSLESLSCSKYKILNKEPANTPISPRDFFIFNSHFTCRMQRIKIPLPHRDEKNELLKAVYEERPQAVEASIVRIMKHNKVMTHSDLVAECVKQLRPKVFEPNVKLIKKKIESLIDREYMKPDRDNMNTYIYLA